MKLTIFEEKRIDNRTWYLCKANLLEYLEGLKPNFYDYAIQRRIVKNQYLDKLYTTIKVGEPIPVITLTHKELRLENDIENKSKIDLHKSEILDGLQRSFRLWSLLTISKKYQGEDYRKYALKIKETNPLFFDSGVVSTKLIKNLIETSEIYNIENAFRYYDIYFVIWTGLTEKEIIQKMLVLNAGQKSVSPTHQFELLFLHIYEELKSNDIGIKLYREKDKEANNIKKGNRDIGELMFSSLIVALQSFVEGRPLRVSAEKMIDIEFDENNSEDNFIFEEVFNNKFILFFLNEIYKLDKIISQESKGKEWFSKDTTLSGIFAGIGSIVKLNSTENIYDSSKKTFELLNNKIENYTFNLGEFTKEYNELSSRNVNIGNFIRKAIMNYVIELLRNNEPNWSNIFKSSTKYL
ncbi:MAG: hypothetical protein LUH22_12930 [Bacteroides sp.]|nr:hypothetical protein [Bacteroides sp.]